MHPLPKLVRLVRFKAFIAMICFEISHRTFVEGKPEIEVLAERSVGNLIGTMFIELTEAFVSRLGSAEASLAGAQITGTVHRRGRLRVNPQNEGTRVGHRRHRAQRAYAA